MKSRLESRSAEDAKPTRQGFNHVHTHALVSGHGDAEQRAPPEKKAASTMAFKEHASCTSSYDSA